MVAQEIGKLRAEMQKKYEITHESHLKELGQLRDESRKTKLGQRLQMLKLHVEKQVVYTLIEVCTYTKMYLI